MYDACIGVASTLLAPAQLRMAKLALSMHLTSPTVRMFDQIATQSGAKEVTCDTFVSIASRKICDNDALKDVLKSYNQYDVASIILYFFVFKSYYKFLFVNNVLGTVWFLLISLPKVCIKLCCLVRQIYKVRTWYQ